MVTTLGIDKTKGGWVVVAAAKQTIRACQFMVTVDEILAAWPDAAAYAIDIPLFLVESGTRGAEAELRTLLGPAARSMFTSPTRAALDAATQAEATSINRAHGGPGISAQSFGLFAAIREARNAIGELQPELRGRWRETHPESAFVVLAESLGHLPLAPKRSAAGALDRIALLNTVFSGLLGGDYEALPNQVKIDDVLDAAAAAWSAQRLVDGTARVFGTGTTDPDGHRDLVAI